MADGKRADDERLQRYADSMAQFYGDGVVASPEEHRRRFAHAVMAVADAEQAELRAEVDRLILAGRLWAERADAAEAKVAELRRIIMQGGQDAASVRRQAIAALDAE